MPKDKPRKKKLEDHEPGASREEVLTAIEKTAQPIADKRSMPPEK